MDEIIKGSLSGIKVLDFSTLLPGPLASLFLAETGAEVIKIERPEVGDEIRTSYPKWGGQSASFSMLNRGKKSLALDLKDPDSFKILKPLIKKDRRICDKRTIANTKAMIRTFVIKLFAQKISKRKANMANNLLRGSKR